MPPLTEAKLRAIKPSGKIERFYDQHGLYLELSAAGGKLWRWKYRFDGKEKRLALGTYPDVTLAQAREKRDDARKVLRDGIDPGIGNRKKADPLGGRSFESVAREWYDAHIPVWSQGHAETVSGRLVKDVYGSIGKMPIASITPGDMLKMLREIEKRDALEVAKRVKGICSQIFRYAVPSGLVDSDPCRDLSEALKPRIPDHFAALTTKKDVGEMMVRIDAYKGGFVVRHALLFSALTFCRPGTVRHAEWAEIDFEGAMWTVPATKMKLTKAKKSKGIPFYVPLARQTLEVLKRLQHFTGNGSYIFPSSRGKGKPMSENAVNGAVRRMGYSEEEMTAHGFRSTASTLLNEEGIAREDVIEAQLAHVGSDKTRAIYNRAEYMILRRKLMQDWADMLDSLRADAVAKADQRMP